MHAARRATANPNPNPNPNPSPNPNPNPNRDEVVEHLQHAGLLDELDAAPLKQQLDQRIG